MKTDTIFRLASTTKRFVRRGDAARRGRQIDLAAPVSKYIPGFADLKVGVETVDPATDKPTLTLLPQNRPMIGQDLLRHTAGLVYGQFGDKARAQGHVEAKVGDRNDTLAEMVAKNWPKLSSRSTGPAKYGNTASRSTCWGGLFEIVIGSRSSAYVFITERDSAKPLGMTATDLLRT